MMTTKNTLFLFGSGGHAKVVIDAASHANPGLSLIIMQKPGTTKCSDLLNCPVKPELDLTNLPEKILAHVAIGNNAIRAKIAKKLWQYGHMLQTIIHLQSSVSTFSSIQSG